MPENTAPPETPAPSPTPPPSPPADPNRWPESAQQRVDQLTARLNETRQRLEEATRRATANPPPPPPPPSPAQIDPNSPEFRSAVRVAAQQEAATVEFNRQCQEAYKAGERAFGDQFASRVNSLRGLMNERDPESVANFNSFVATALETGSAPKILHELGANLNRALEILRMAPVKRAIELSKMADASEEPGTEGQDTGNARQEPPRPLTPVGGRSAAVTQVAPDDPARADQLDSATWMARRNAQIKDRGGEPWARR